MKKIIYLLIACTIAFIGCTPLDDVYSELDKKNPITTDVIGDGEYTLTEDDYKVLELKTNYFTSETQAKKLLPPFLKEKYNFWTKGSSAVITYNLSNKVSKESYTVTDDDYKAIELKALTSESDYKKFLDYKYPNAKKGDLVELTYLTNPEITKYTLVNADYELVGNGKYKNFDIREGKTEETEEARRKKINTILLKNFPDSKEGDTYSVAYKFYNGSPGTMEMNLVLKSGTWEILKALSYVETTNTFANSGKWEMPFELTSEDYRALGQKYDNFSGRNKNQKEEAYNIISKYLSNKFPYESKNSYKTVKVNFYEGGGKTTKATPTFIFDGSIWGIMKESLPTTLQFGFDGTKWVPDNTIKYTLTSADFELVGNGKYKNFDVRAGKDEETVEARVTKISTILLRNFPNAEEGQKYLVTYAIYNGSAGMMSTKVIKEGNKYVEFKE